jgi:hypothetical protein
MAIWSAALRWRLPTLALPGAFDNQVIGYDSNGDPFLQQQQGDGSFASADSPVGMTRGDYGALAQGTNALTPAYSTYLSGERAATSKASLETGKQVGKNQVAMIRKTGQVEAAGIRADACCCWRNGSPLLS